MYALSFSFILEYSHNIPHYIVCQQVKLKRLTGCAAGDSPGGRTIVRLITSSTGLVFFTSADGGEFLLRPRFPATQQPEPEQLFPVSTPAALFTSDSPGNTSSPGNSQPSLGPEPEQFIGLLPRFAAGPGSCGSCWYFNPNNLSAYSQPRRLPIAADSRSAAGGYPEQFVGLSPGTSAALIPNPEYS